MSTVENQSSTGCSAAHKYMLCVTRFSRNQSIEPYGLIRQHWRKFIYTDLHKLSEYTCASPEAIISAWACNCPNKQAELLVDGLLSNLARAIT